MLIEATMLLALAVPDLSTKELEKYYWDCDTLFMKGEMGGQDIMSCLAITDEFQARVFNNDQSRFREYWNRNKVREWSRRGYQHKNQTH